MNLLLKRHAFGSESTGGLLFINEEHFCYTCEDQQQPNKVMHETCIPKGRYQIKLRNEGGMNVRYKQKYSFHKGMLHLQNVPNFEYIYIHVGNDDDDTSGCILVGLGIRTVDKESAINGSVLAYTFLYGIIMLAIEQGEEIWIEVA